MDKLWKTFIKQFPVIEAAGGLVERTDNKLLFIFRNNKWDLPKGGVEKKELIIEAAQREVIEETGVSDLIVQKQLSETFHIFKKGKRFNLQNLKDVNTVSSDFGAFRYNNNLYLTSGRKQKGVQNKKYNNYTSEEEYVLDVFKYDVINDVCNGVFNDVSMMHSCIQ